MVEEAIGFRSIGRYGQMDEKTDVIDVIDVMTRD
jgi:hypothetical protein